MNIISWAERNLKTVDSETGHAVKRVKLMSVEGNVWETWEAPFPVPAEFVREVETVVAALAEELPARKIQMMLVADDAQGTHHSECPFTTWGKNKQAAAGLLANDGTRALAESMDAQAKTMERILSTANTQMRLMSEFNEKLLTANHDLLELIKQKEEHAALTAAESAEVTNAIGGAIKENLPLILSVFEKIAGPKVGKVLNGAKTVAAAAQAAQTIPGE